MTFIVLSAIADDFDVTLGAVGWVVIVESLIISALLLPMGAVADAVGRRRVLLLGMIVFAIGTILTGLAPSFALLIAARIVAAIGNTLVQSIGTGLLVAAFPPHERGLAIGGQTTAVAVGSLTGPLAGGLLLDVLSWQTLFLLIAVPSVISALAVWLMIEPDEGDRKRIRDTSFDRIGAVLSAAMITAIVLTINNPFEFAWLSPFVLGGAVLSLGLLVAFIRQELAVDGPMLELRLFAIPTFRWAVIVRLIGFMSSTTVLFLLPIYLLSLRQISTGQAGFIVALSALGMGGSAQLSGRLYDRVGPLAPTMFGLIVQVVVNSSLALTGGETSMVLLGLLSFINGIAVGFWNVPNNSAMLGATPPEALGVGGAFTNTTRTIGNVLGQAVAAAVVVAVMRAQDFNIPLGDIDEVPAAGRAFVDGWRITFWVAAGFAALALAAGTRLPRGVHAGTV